MVPIPQQQDFMVCLKSTKQHAYVPYSFSLWQSNIEHCQIISTFLQNYCSKTSSFVKDSTDLIQKIKHLSVNPEEENLVSFYVSALFISMPVPVALQVINSKISTCTSFTNVCKIPTEIFIKLLESTLTNCIFCFNKKFYKQFTGCNHGFTCLPCHFRYLHGTL